MSTIVRLGTPAAVLFLAMGCEAGENRTDSSLDSAGIRIVVNAAPPSILARSWRVNPQPLVDIGAETGPPESHLYRVRDAFRWRGNIVVLNGITEDLRVFDRRGTYLRSIGRRGHGPGEFAGLFFARVLSDGSIITWDFRNDRVSVFDTAGVFVRTMSLERDDAFGAFLSPAALLGGGKLLTVSGRHLLELGAESGRFVDSSTIAIHDLDGSIVTIIGRRASGERMRYIRGDHVTTLEAPFARALQIVEWQDGYCLGFGTTYEIRCARTYDGPAALWIRLTDASRTVTAEDIDSYVERELAVRSPQYARAFRRTMDDLTFREGFPAFGEFKADADGNLWVAEYVPSGAAPTGWHVFDAQGALVGHVTTPPDLRVFRVYPDAVLGVWKDSLDVEHVRVHEIIR